MKDKEGPFLNMEFGRRAHKWTLEEMSPKVGIGATWISLFERGRLIPSDDQLKRISAALGIPPELVLEEAVAGVPPAVEDPPHDPKKDQEYVDIALGAQNEPTTA